MTPEVIGKLEEAFLLGCSDKEACLFAEVHPATMYDYQQLHPEFVERKEQLKSNPVLQARTAVVNAVSTDPDLAMKFLERKCKNEFSLKTESAVMNTNVEIDLDPDTAQKAAKAYSDILKSE